MEMDERRNAELPFAPFHWEIEFPEAFERDNPGFDGFVGNPPFAGKNTVAAGNVIGYPIWLKEMHEDSHGNADLVAHFYRRAFNLVRDGGTFGLIATNTIAQGDTRSSGFTLDLRARWRDLPRYEAVQVARRRSGDRQRSPRSQRGILWARGCSDGETVDQITAFLFSHGGHADPQRLGANSGKSFQGTIVLGIGFTFDDTDKKGIASSLAEMQCPHRL